MAEDTEIDALRAELDRLDTELLRTAVRRLEVARRIGTLKQDEGRALFDRSREREVLARSRATAASIGLAPEIGEHLVHTLVEAAHDVQEGQVQRAAEGRRFALVGGRGAMGRLFARVLGERGHAVDVLEKDDGRDRARVVRAADVTMVAVDMAHAEEVVAELAPHVRADALLCDVNSLKEGVCAVYQRFDTGEALGLHPMFGGTVGSLRRQKVVVCRVRSGPMTEWLLGELGQLGVELIETDPVTHDRAMAIVQVLTHFRTVVMGEALRRAGMPIAESLRFTSPIYRLELAFVGRLFAQDPDLYASIIFDNPRSAEMRRTFREAVEAVEAAVRAGDREAFRALFDGVGAFFDGFSEDAMRLSDQIIDHLVSRA